MNILIIGAHGKVGQLLIKELVKRSHNVFGMIRSRTQEEVISGLGAKPVTGDLEKNFEHVFDNIDVVVFTAGSGSKTGPDKTILVDEKGAIRSIDLAMKNNVKRFIMVSAQGARDPETESPIRHYYKAKHKADNYLIHSGIDYTIFRPGRLLDEPGEGKVMVSEYFNGKGNTHRSDLALAIAEVIETSAALNKTLEIFTGDSIISEVFKNV